MSTISYINQNTQIIEAEFVRLDLVRDDDSIQVVTLSNSYRSETIGGEVYTPYGSLLGISTQQRDLKLTGYDTTISLAGVDPQNIFYLLSDTYKLKGSRVRLYRGFYDPATYQLSGVVLRFTGVITNWLITEEVSSAELKDTVTCAITCSNFKTVLENRQAGRMTNVNSWARFFPNDRSMENVAALHNIDFNFGR